MIGGGDQAQNFFSIKYIEKSSFSRQLHRYSEQASINDSQPFGPFHAAYNPQTSSRYQKQNISPDNKNIIPRKKRSENSSLYAINKDSTRIDIELHDQNMNGGKWENMKGRVVYRNNTPKNSFYLLSSMKELSQQNQQQLPSLSKNLSRDELEFNSKFESGNAAAVVRTSRKQYCVFTREDTNTHGLRQWFYFEVKCNKSMKVHFRIYSFSKHYSLYRRGMKPYMLIDKDWRQAGEDVTYCRDPNLNCYFLAFSMTLQEGRRLQIANMPPYTYSYLLRFLNSLQQSYPLHCENIGKSLGGVDIPCIQMVQKKKGEERRRAIVILGRTHPGETCSSFSLQRIAKGICDSEILRNTYDFFIVPMVNPDGVIVGNHRTSLAGADLNRRFTATSAYHQLFPQVQAVKKLVRSLQGSHSLQFLFDMHGHSAQSGVFAYAGYEAAGSQHFLKSRIMPKLLSEAWQGFNYSSCAFEQAREKATTARVHFRSKCNITSVTIEQSYGLLGNSLISVTDWRCFGDAFLLALSEYTRLYLQDPVALAKALEEETQSQLKQQKIRQQIALNRQAKLKQEIQDKQQIHAKDNRKETPPPVEDVPEQEDSLSSGDENLEITEAELNFIHQNMSIKMRQFSQRQPYELNDKTIQYEQRDFDTKVRHSTIHDKLPLVSRILRTKRSKVSTQLIDILTSRSKNPSAERVNTINAHLRLPSLPQRL